ncbi:hypothetical protein [Xylanimonas sp. McL0601]|uniref:hypothetical protein n=1 Tax=Xylanimonas sp. McL0601 TaxID=3414739 RepID=UPI003CF98198
MSTVNETQPTRERSMLYLVVGIAIGVLVVLGLVFFRQGKASADAEAKADQLIQALNDAGATVSPAKDRVVAVLGDDGGAVCANPNYALSRSTLEAQLTNGAAGPGMRPVMAERRRLEGIQLVIQIYCPDELKDFQAYVESLKTVDSGA